MVVDDTVKDNAVKSLVMVRLGIHYGKAVVLIGLFRLPHAHRDAQIAYHGEVVGPGDLVDARNVGIVNPRQQNAPQRQRRSQGIGVGIDKDAPAVFLVQ